MASSYLTRTPSSSGNRRKFTFSAWVRFNLNELANNSRIFSCGSATSAWVSAYINSNYTLQLAIVEGGTTYDILTNRVLRDSSAWYHLVFVVDTENATANNRLRMYINGEEVTDFSQRNNPTQNLDTQANTASKPIDIGSAENVGYTPRYFPGYMSHVAMVDGTVLTPTSFGETDSTSGIWKFKAPSGLSWGTNGFHLKFENSGALGTDSSGQGNNFTVQGTLKQSLDTPSNLHATFNPLFQKSLPSTVNMGNTRLDQGSSAWKSSLTTIGASAGKWYAEFKAGTISSGSPYKYNQFGVVHESITFGGTFGYVGDSDYGWGLNWGGNVNHDGQNVSGYTGFTTGDIISVAMDLDNHKVYWRKNGAAWMNGGDPTSGSTGTGAQSLDTGKIYFFAASVYANECFANFGDGFFGTTAITSAGSNGNGSLFEYDVPNGYYALNTKNLNTYG
jgi:hypothetical protein